MKQTGFSRTAWHKSIVFKVSLSIVMLMALSVLLLSYLILAEEKEHTERELLKIGVFITETLARQASLPVLYKDGTSLQNLIGVFTTNSPIPTVENFVAYALIYDREENLLARSGKPEEIEQIGRLPENPGNLETHFIRRVDREHFEISAPITYQGNRIGLIRVGITEKYRNELLNTVEKKTLLATGILIAIGILTSLFMARKFIRPILILADFARRIGDRRWGETVKIKTSDEIGGLARTFNEMSRKLKTAFDEIQKTQNQLIQSEKFSALGKLSANLAHELKNPLTSIKLIMETATETENQVDCTPQDLEIMLQEVARMENTVNDILSFAGPQTFNRRENNIHDVIRGVIAQIRYRLEISDMRPTLVLDEDMPPFPFDAKRMAQVLMNLILNAVQAMPEGGELDIRTEWDPAPREAVIRISDTGPGIPESQRNQIFDPFFTTKEHGTGLGLSIVYTVVRSHEGHIEVENSNRPGTTFRITLPAEEILHAADPDRG